MTFQQLRVYFKAAVIVPFYVAILLSATVVVVRWILYNYNWQLTTEDTTAHQALMIAFISGITGLLTLSSFLNCYPTINRSLLYSLLAWMLLPYSYIACILIWYIDWKVMAAINATMQLTTFLIILIFLHVIGIVIAYMDFRASIVMTMKQEKVNRSVQYD